MKYLIFAALIYGLVSCSSMSNSSITLEGEDCVKSSLIPISTIDPNVENYDDLEFLDDIVGDKKIVLLGESGHTDGSTTLLKTRLIKYLHKKLGFNVLAFESGLYDGGTFFSPIHFQSFDSSTITFAPEVWSLTEEFQPLRYYIEKQVGGPFERLDMVGLDCDHSNNYDVVLSLSRNLYKYLRRNDIELSMSQKGMDSLISILAAVGEKANYKGDPIVLDSIVLNILSSFEVIKSKKNSKVESQEFEYWKQIVGALVPCYRYLQMSHDAEAYAKGDPYMVRDSLMSVRLQWIDSTFFSKKGKFIIWCANAHMLKNFRGVSSEKIVDKQYLTLGQCLFDRYGDDMYSIGFTSYAGSYRSHFYQNQFKSIHPPDSSFETILHSTGVKQGFFDLSKRRCMLLRDSITSSILSHFPRRLSLASVFDGVVFIDSTQPARIMSK